VRSRNNYVRNIRLRCFNRLASKFEGGIGSRRRYGNNRIGHQSARALTTSGPDSLGKRLPTAEIAFLYNNGYRVILLRIFRTGFF